MLNNRKIKKLKVYELKFFYTEDGVKIYFPPNDQGDFPPPEKVITFEWSIVYLKSLISISNGGPFQFEDKFTT